MKTLVFCTSYATSARDWDDRQKVWVRSLRQSELHFDQLLIIDDGSSVLPDWPDVPIVREHDAPTPEDVETTAPVVLYTHSERLGRQSVFEFPGWHRSFAFGVLYGAAHGFEKIIHIESDAHLISRRMQRYFNDVRSGWLACWCESYQFPEIAIQAAAGDEVADMVAFAREPYAKLAGQIHENLIPFTHIERSFIGNRYGEMIGHVPEHADFSAQTHVGQPDTFYWWISPPDGANRAARRESVAKLRSPFPRDVLEGSWSAPEDGYHWMLDFDSSLYLPPVTADGEFDLELDMFPCVYLNRRAQRVYTLVNETLVNDISLLRLATIACRVPAGLLKRNAPNRLRFLHPDAFAPCEVGPHTEARKLGVALSRCELLRRL